MKIRVCVCVFCMLCRDDDDDDHDDDGDDGVVFVCICVLCVIDGSCTSVIWLSVDEKNCWCVFPSCCRSLCSSCSCICSCWECKCLYGVDSDLYGNMSSWKCVWQLDIICFVSSTNSLCAGCDGSGPRYIVVIAGFLNFDVHSWCGNTM